MKHEHGSTKEMMILASTEYAARELANDAEFRRVAADLVMGRPEWKVILGRLGRWNHAITQPGTLTATVNAAMVFCFGCYLDRYGDWSCTVQQSWSEVTTCFATEGTRQRKAA